MKMEALNSIWFIFFVVAVFADDLNNHAFPDDFMFGTATASYQVEGGWNADGKGESIWDRFVHEDPDRILNRDNGDIACDSYHKYKEDVQLLKYLGVNHYRFSLSWTRMFPTGFVNEVNEPGVAYYRNLIKELRDNNIEPLVTLYHWDLPERLQELGGWTSDNSVEWFGEYARKCFEFFGDAVKYWMTINEGPSICIMGYGGGLSGYFLAPGVNASGIGEYLCAHNVIRAHARAWHIYDEEFRKKQNGTLGMVIPSGWYEPASNSSRDIEAAQRTLDFMFGWWANPLLNGDYPATMKQNIARRSQEQGFSRSRLPEFTSDEIEYIKGTCDILGVNVYTANLVTGVDDPQNYLMGWSVDVENHSYQLDEWPSSASEWLKVTPWAMRNLIKWIKDTYNSPKIIITENGFSDNGTSAEDDERIYYIQTYLSSLRDGMEQDGIDVIGYTYWSLLDNFEWSMGYSQKFGIFNVDFDTPNRTRTAKKSVEYFKKVIQTRCVVDSCE